MTPSLNILLSAGELNSTHFKLSNGAIEKRSLVDRWICSCARILGLRMVHAVNREWLEGMIDGLRDSEREIIWLQNLQRSLVVRREGSLFSTLFPDQESVDQISGKIQNKIRVVELTVDQIAREKIAAVSEEALSPHTPQQRFFERQLYYYDQHDVHVNHQQEGVRILLATQWERFVAALGRLITCAASLFGRNITPFEELQYFRHAETAEEIYADDSAYPTADPLSYYWFGHASGIFSVRVEGVERPVTIYTDPVLGDLNSVLYPRMTRKESLEDKPHPHVVLFSHNHRDHWDDATIEQLKKYQPVMIAPEGDGEKLREMGFENVVECGWWDKVKIPIQGSASPLEITAVPARHWSGRGPCDGHHSLFVGYVIGTQVGDVYFAGDTARLSDEHLSELGKQFNIRYSFQPGGPDDNREDMESTHQASVDGVWMHFRLMLSRAYQDGMTKEEFLEAAQHYSTVFMHTKTYKLGNLHFDDTESSIQRLIDAIRSNHPDALLVYEKQVYTEVLELCKGFLFEDGPLSSEEIAGLIDAGVTIPKLASMTGYPGL